MNKKSYIVITLLMALTLLIRVYYILLPIEISIREGSNGLAAWRIAMGDLMYRDFYHSQTPIFAHLLSVFFVLFGVGLIQGRMFNALFSGLTFLAIYYNGKKIDIKTGVLGSLIFILSPVTIKYGAMILTDLPAITFCLFGYYFLQKNFEERSSSNGISIKGMKIIAFKNLILAGFFVGLGIFTKLIVAPILLAFLTILVLERYFTHIEIKRLLKEIIALLIGFLIACGIILPYFLLQAREPFFFMVLGQHLEKPPRKWLARFAEPIIRMIQADLIFILFFLINLPRALKTRYGRGLIVCISFMLVFVFLTVPWPNSNYYEINFFMMIMICGMFPFPPSILKNVNNFSNLLNISRRELAKLTFIVVFIIYLVISPLLFRVPLNYEFEFANVTAPITIQSHLNEIDESPKLAADWVEHNTSPDEYILSDQSVINLMSKRRGPFTEVSVDRMRVGQLNSDLMIQAILEYEIRVVVVSGRAFGKYEEYDPFLIFLDENFVPIEAGYTIYVREGPLKFNQSLENIMKEQICFENVKMDLKR